MSRSELADAVNTALQRLHPGRAIAAHFVDNRWVGKLERGEHRWPSDERRAALRHTLGVATDIDIDLYIPRRTSNRQVRAAAFGIPTARSGPPSDEPVVGDLLRLAAPTPGHDRLLSHGDTSWGRAILAPEGQHFSGAAIDVESYLAVDDGRVLATITNADVNQQWRRPVQRRLILGHVGTSDHGGVFALDSRQASRRLAAVGPQSRLPIPRAYRLDPITAGVLWAVANLDVSLLLDDARLAAAHAAASPYKSMARSAASPDVEEDLDSVSRLWIGSAFCADHIRRHHHLLSGVPIYWTREQRGEEASTWLLFGHKLRYLRETVEYFRSASQPMTRMFHVPSHVVTTSSLSERILLLFAVALMESLGIRTAVTDDTEYASLPGLVMDDRHVVEATWIRAESLWQVDVTSGAHTVATYRDALHHVRDHSIIADHAPRGRLRHLADYLSIDWRWLRRRCADLGQCGVAGLAEPRSRLLSLDGVDQACRYIGALS